MSSIYFAIGFIFMFSLSFGIGGLFGFAFMHLLATSLEEIR